MTVLACTAINNDEIDAINPWLSIVVPACINHCLPAPQHTLAHCSPHNQLFSRLQNGNDAGLEINITLMEGARKGRLGVCSQSLHNDAEWLRDWVDHQFDVGADEVILHTPQVCPCLGILSLLDYILAQRVIPILHRTRCCVHFTNTKHVSFFQRTQY